MPSILLQPEYTDVRTYTGDPGVPALINWQRKYTAQAMQAAGTPVLIKRRYNIEDVENGVAIESPTMESSYGQSTYSVDPISYGVGYASVETQPGEWYNTVTPKEPLFIGVIPPDDTWAPAPKYRGFGPGFLTYAILPDRREDVWKLDGRGALIRQQTAMVQLPWWPYVGDTDLVITCSLDNNGLIAETYERYQLMQVTPITMRGRDQSGFREFQVNAGGNRYWVGQQAEMAKYPTNDITYMVETDR